MMPSRITFSLMLVLLALPTLAQSSDYAEGHPRLLLSVSDVEMITTAKSQPPTFESAVQEAKQMVDPYLLELPDVPVPSDAGGGYTHEQHKRNSAIILNAGTLYQLSGNEAYAYLARDLLLAYAALYPTLGDHPKKKNEAPGRLFWQSLNEAVWLVTSIQGYDAIFDILATEDRETIETQLLRRMVTFLSDESPTTFNKIHNHGTWATAAVGMTGYVLDDPEYVEKALYGLEKDGNAGFFKQLDTLFSPDGYYSEGPYYQRYALMPFLLFAQAIERNEPQREIFAYRNDILLKAVYSSIQLSYGGFFFPLNDAIKDKGLDTIELYYGVSIAFGMNSDPELISIAQIQRQVVLTGDGYRLAAAMDAGLAQPFSYQTMQLSDGPDGTQGALNILRSFDKSNEQALVFKATVQGQVHGHFDRLNWLFYDNGNEIISDYGAARYLNVEEKNGGHYLRENDAWAKQTVAHNTLVVDQKSHFDGDWNVGEETSTNQLIFESDEKLQITAARMEGAYPDVEFTRVMAMINSDQFSMPVILDVLKVEAQQAHQYDLPLHYLGQLTAVSPALTVATQTLSVLGSDNGYQFLWNRAETELESGDLFQLTWLNGNRFYTYSALADSNMQAIFTETGANDPEFNLRWEPGLILRASDSKNHTFLALLEPHGEYNGAREFTTASASRVAELKRYSDGPLDLIRVETNDGAGFYFALSYYTDADANHSMSIEGKSFNWSGFYQLFEDD